MAISVQTDSQQRPRPPSHTAFHGTAHSPGPWRCARQALCDRSEHELEFFREHILDFSQSRQPVIEPHRNFRCTSLAHRIARGRKMAGHNAVWAVAYRSRSSGSIRAARRDCVHDARRVAVKNVRLFCLSALDVLKWATDSLHSTRGSPNNLKEWR